MKTITFLLVVVALVVGADYFFRHRERAKQGPGVELRAMQLLDVTLCQALVPKRAKVGDKLVFHTRPTAPVGSTAIGDAWTEGATLEASVIAAGYSERLGKHAVLFKFDSVVLANGERSKFTGAVFSPEDPQHGKEAGIMGSFVGLQLGAGGVIGGWLVGNLMPHYAGKVFDAPVCYAISEVAAGTEILVKVHSADFIPFEIKPEKPH